MRKQQSLVIYKSSKGAITLKADFKHETVWATQAQIADLFAIKRPAITKHLSNIFASGELSRDSVCSILEQTAADGKKYKTLFYNLDAIISVGYRVNSKQATQFRQWATKTLREYILKGAVFNADRIKKLHGQSIMDLSKKIDFIQRTIRSRQLSQTEAEGLLSVINGYAQSWLLLERYDKGQLIAQRTKGTEKKRLAYTQVRKAIDQLAGVLREKREASEFFGSERDGTLQGILESIYQTFGGKELYASREERAAHLLYFIIKDHPFTDGNKRIGSFLFIVFLEQNGMLYRPSGEKKINDTALVALALLIAESNPNEKEQLIALVTHLLK
ncbi:MAG: virulence RhuM family protein [Candidatus Pacebacteria bacterium]|nr:virulence RhuM family protein [Candidatus Paceibacterota bacterium]